jgi:hypothetical protein
LLSSYTASKGPVFVTVITGGCMAVPVFGSWLKVVVVTDIAEQLLMSHIDALNDQPS